MEELEVGDIVQLKSGGPKMTVDEVERGGDPDRILCRWFAGSKHEHGAFKKQTLTKILENSEK